MKASPWHLVAVALPMLLYVGHIGQSEYRLSQGVELTLEIQGYDPRDLLRGRYLRFGYVIHRDRDATPRDRGIRAMPDACYVPLQPGSSETTPLIVEPCDKAPTQAAWVHGRFITGQQQFFLPEDKARAVETQFIKHGGALRVKVLDTGKVLVRELLIKDTPWREFLDALPPEPPKPQ